MPYYKSYKKNDKWYALGFISVFGALIGLTLHFNEEYSEENIRKQQELNRKYVWPTEQTYVPETTFDRKDTSTSKDTLFDKDTIDAKLK